MKELIRKSGGCICLREAKINRKYIAAQANDSEKENTGYLQSFPPFTCRAVRLAGHNPCRETRD